MKGNSEMLDFTSPEEVLNHIKEKFETFSKETLHNVFLNGKKD